jgi:eukaryotic-like serine/threonine-protein kinase
VSDDMKRDRWEKLKSIFTDALALDEQLREEYLRNACGSDRELLHEVLSLLAAYENPGVIDRSIESLKTSFLKNVAEGGVKGRSIGSYQVLDELGHGGMGSVYLAERADGEFKQKVALKLLRSGLTSGEQRQRFRIERQILATLNHDNIARLYDGGITDDGQPFFVMEYIEGQALDTHCEAHTLTIRQRLQLFAQVCHAVHYAHRKLVVHRDLKPANIFITYDGNVKLLDFGIAKAQNLSEVAGEAMPVTREGVVPLTPTYASPEQVRGEPITTASDIYQLGIVLYQLLAGRRPYEIGGSTPSETERIICEEEPIRPSAAVRNNSHLQRQLRGDLDTIVMKALSKEADRRYDSAEGFAADIRRYLAGKPVSAYPDSRLYRTGKFVRRHRLGVASTTAIIVLLIGYALTITWHSQRTGEALEEAKRETEKAEQVTTFLMDMFQASDPSEALGDTVTARVLLERGSRQAAQFDNRPDLQAQMFGVIGQVYGRLGRYGRAAELLEQALDVRRDHYGMEDRNTAMTKVHLANVLRKAGDFNTADSLLQDALSIQRSVLSPLDPQLAITLSFLGGVRMALGRYDVAEVMLREALAIQRNVYDSDNLDTAETLNILALLLDEKGDIDSAIQLMHESLRMRRALLSHNDPRLAMSANNLGMFYRKKGEYRTAEPLYREALEIKRTVFGDDHPSLAVTLNGLGLLMQDLENDEASEPFLRQALSIRRKALGDNHPRVAASLNNLGNVIEEQGRLEEAAGYFREARLIIRESLGDTHPFFAYPSVGLSRIYMKREQAHKAEPLIRHALKIRNESFPESHWQIAELEGYLGHCLTLLGQYAEAESLLTSGYGKLQEQLGSEHKTTQQTRRYLLDLYDRWNKPELAEAVRDRK